MSKGMRRTACRMVYVLGAGLVLGLLAAGCAGTPQTAKAAADGSGFGKVLTLPLSEGEPPVTDRIIIMDMPAEAAVHFESDDPRVLEVEGIEGSPGAALVTARKPGTARIVARDGAGNELGVFSYRVNTLYEPYRIDWGLLESFTGRRPRLHVDAERLEAVRTEGNGLLARQFTDLFEQADKWCDPNGGFYVINSLMHLGYRVEGLAFAYRLTGDAKYLSNAVRLADMVLDYKTWGPATDDHDLHYGVSAEGLSLLYDLCYDDLDAAKRMEIRDRLAYHADKVVTNYHDPDERFKHLNRQFLQNHCVVTASGLIYTGLTLFDEVDLSARAKVWLETGLEIMAKHFYLRGTDGAGHEGILYFSLVLDALVKSADILKPLTGIDLFEHPWMKNASRFYLYTSLAREHWGRPDPNYGQGYINFFDYSDYYRLSSYGPDYLLYRLAAAYNDGLAQWLGMELTARDPIPHAYGAVRNLYKVAWPAIFWYDPSIQAQDPIKAFRYELHHFEDMGIVTTRSDWSGNEAILFCKCGPYAGKSAVAKSVMNAGGGHVHPDAGHFSIYANGEYLLRDDGYVSKLTEQHNTLTVNGVGQVGDEQDAWGLAGIACETNPSETPRQLSVGFRQAEVGRYDFDYMIADATGAYKREAGVQGFRRYFLYIKPNVLIVVDDIKLSHTGTMKLHFWPEPQLGEYVDDHYEFVSDRNTLHLKPLTTEGISHGLNAAAIQSLEYEELGPYTRLDLVCNGRNWLNAIAISWAATDDTGAGKGPVEVVFTDLQDGRWYFQIGERGVTLDFANEEAFIEDRSRVPEIIPKENAIILEAEELAYTMTTAPGTVGANPDPKGAGGGKYLYFSAEEPGDYIEYELAIPAGRYQIDLVSRDYTTRGICRASLDGTVVDEEIDMYAKWAGYVLHPLGEFTFTGEAPRVLRLTVTGKNPASAGYRLDLDYVKLVELKD